MSVLRFNFFISIILITFLSCNTDDNDANRLTGLHVVAKQPNTWQYVSKETMYSRDGNTTGYMANINPESANLVIYLEGGGACFNAPTCGQNRDHFDETDAQAYEQFLAGNVPQLFNRDLAQNNFKDWSYVFVPYSTGDVHSGTNEDADVTEEITDQHMQGFTNFSEVVKEIINYYGRNGLQQILIAGSSAGGYGTYLNFSQVAQQFPNAQLTLLADASPIFINSTVFPSCLADYWNNLYEFNFPSDYDATQTDGPYNSEIEGIYDYLSHKYPDAHFGLYTDLEDAVIRYFFGFGQANCTANQTVSAGEFEMACNDLAAYLYQYDNWATFLKQDTGHTVLLETDYTKEVVNTTNFNDWLNKLVMGEADNVAP